LRNAVLAPGTTVTLFAIVCAFLVGLLVLRFVIGLLKAVVWIALLAVAVVVGARYLGG
jgi:hypothetical protein